MNSTTENNKLPSYEETTRSPSFSILESGSERELSPGGPPPYALGRRQRWQFHIDRYLPKLGLPLATLVGGGITAGTTYSLVRHVIHLVENAKVSSDPHVWMQESRTSDYDPCYLGCDDCADPSFAYNACVRTSEIHIKDLSVVCDARRIWNWIDRYPAECLLARGEYYREAALEGLKQSYRNQLAVISLTVLAGIFGAWVVCRVWTAITAKNRRRAEEMIRNWPGWRNNRVRVRATNRFGALLASLLAFCGRPAAAYPCVGHGQPHDVYFANVNRTVFANVHGWIGNCYDTTRCTPMCTPVCDKNGCTMVCTTSCVIYTHTEKEPWWYVDNITPRVTRCGFEVVHSPDVSTNLRVANPGIEKNWWVKISVNGYNVTDPLETDPSVICLHDIGGS
ncbi:hypothetical protein F5X99DRAFT_392378 [Biscogniauxia marginata]|nr:hypothetical protein F5X99DRAFT_392378 [Biscogniauxia marginata]